MDALNITNQFQYLADRMSKSISKVKIVCMYVFYILRKIRTNVVDSFYIEERV